MNNIYGKYHELDANWRGNSKNPLTPFRNSITRKTREVN